MKKLEKKDFISPIDIYDKTFFSKESRKFEYIRNTNYNYAYNNAVGKNDVKNCTIKDLEKMKLEKLLSGIPLYGLSDDYGELDSTKIIYLINRLFSNEELFINQIIDIGITMEDIKMLMMSIDANIYGRSLISFFIANRDIYCTSYAEYKRVLDGEIVEDDIVYPNYTSYMIGYIKKSFCISDDLAILVANKLVELYIQKYRLLESLYDKKKNRQKKLTD